MTDDSPGKLPHTHPGEVLSEEFLKPLGITPYRLAKSIDVSQTQIGEILRGARAITPATALKFGAYFSTSAEFWVNLQTAYDLEIERERSAGVVSDIRPYNAELAGAAV